MENPLYVILCLLVSSLSSIRDLVAESTVMKQFDHPNVLSLLGVCVDPDDEDVFKIVLPFMANGDLRSFLKYNRVEPTKIDEYNDVTWMSSSVMMYLYTLPHRVLMSTHC